MRWQSSGMSVARRIDFTTGGPSVRFGTKCPSMTSTWSQSAPAAFMRSASVASRAKSPERIDGAMRTGGAFMRRVCIAPPTRGSGIGKCGDPGELDPLDELERGPASGRDERHPLGEPELPYGGGAVASADDRPRDRSAEGQVARERGRAPVEGRLLEDSER